MRCAEYCSKRLRVTSIVPQSKCSLPIGAAAWGFPAPTAGLPRPSLLFDGRRKKRLRSWREGKNGGTTTVGKRRKDICFKLEFALNLGTLNQDSDTSVWVNTALSLRLCAGVSPPQRVKNWVRGVPLLGGYTA